MNVEFKNVGFIPLKPGLVVQKLDGRQKNAHFLQKQSAKWEKWPNKKHQKLQFLDELNTKGCVSHSRMYKTSQKS